MGTMRFAWCFVVMGALLRSPALAHDEEKSHGTALSGFITGVSTGGFTLDTEEGAIEITLTERTKFIDAEEPVGRDVVRPGDHVIVRGSKLPGGGMVAREVMVHGAAPRDSEH